MSAKRGDKPKKGALPQRAHSAPAPSSEDAEIAALLGGGGGRGDEEIDPTPPVRKPKAKPKAQQGAKRLEPRGATPVGDEPAVAVAAGNDDQPLGGPLLGPQPAAAVVNDGVSAKDASVEQPERSSAPQCPACGCRHCPVIYTRPFGRKTMRKRRCRNCRRQFTTTEAAG